jgi:A/G-specific adenine glycosylase
MAHWNGGAASARIAPLLLPWFDANRRDLPWRRTRDPYRIWVSEIMLQQTQIATAVPYYRAFVRAFPTVRKLAAASLGEVLRLWAGLGYYSRARNLQRAAQVIVGVHGGRLPRTYAELRALPGVGDYTAGAVASIAFGERVPAVDGNALRALARVGYFTGNVRSGPCRRRLQELARAAVPAARPGDYNQALMELGSLVCTPRGPACPECCLAAVCEAFRRGEQDRIPSRRARPRTRTVHVVLGVVRRNGRVLIAQRPAGGVWGGLWEFPNAEAAEAPAETLVRHLAETFGLRVEVGETLTTLTHGIMHRRTRLEARHCRVVAGRVRARAHVEARWVRPEDLAEYALPAPHRRVADRLLAHERRGTPDGAQM